MTVSFIFWKTSDYILALTVHPSVPDISVSEASLRLNRVALLSGYGVILSYSHIAFEVLGTIKKNIERNSIWLGCWYYISDKIMNIVAHKYYFLQCKKVLFLFLWIYNLSAGNFIRHVFWGLPLALSCAYLFWNDIWVYVHSSL